MLKLSQKVLVLARKERLRGRKRLLLMFQVDKFPSKQSKDVEDMFLQLNGGVW
jgi:hypothetical protein